MRTPKRLGVLAVACVVVSCAMATGGCYQGFTGTVNNQGPSGNGTEFKVPDESGPIWVRNATIVLAPDGKRAAMSFTAVNNADAPDALLSIVTEPKSDSSQTAPVELLPKAAVKVGGPEGVPIELSGLSVPAGNYAKVVFTFRVAGVSAPQEILVVPAIGYYASYGPSAGTKAEPTASGKAESKKAEPKKAESKKAESKKAESKKAESE